MQSAPGGLTNVFASAITAGAVTASDSTILDFNAVYVGVTGDVAIVLADKITAVTFTAVPAGAILPVQGTKVKSTGTTATNIVWLKW